MSDFSRAAKEADIRGEYSLARRIRAEGRIAKALVKEIISRDCTVSINDGEETVVKNSVDVTECVNAMFSTDEDYVYAYGPDGKRKAFFWLIYGNEGYDVISDYSNTDFGNSVYTSLEPLMSKIERQIG